MERPSCGAANPAVAQRTRRGGSSVTTAVRHCHWSACGADNPPGKKFALFDELARAADSRCANERSPVDSTIPLAKTRRSVQGRHRPPTICVAGTYQTGCQILSASASAIARRPARACIMHARWGPNIFLTCIRTYFQSSTREGEP